MGNYLLLATLHNLYSVTTKAGVENYAQVKILNPLHYSLFPYPTSENKVAYYTSEDIRRKYGPKYPDRPEAQTKSQKIGKRHLHNPEAEHIDPCGRHSISRAIEGLNESHTDTPCYKSKGEKSSDTGHRIRLLPAHL